LIVTESLTVNPELLDLERIRLESNFTYDALAARIGISRRNLFRLLRKRQVVMHARTRHKIQRFIAEHDGRRRTGSLRRVR